VGDAQVAWSDVDFALTEDQEALQESVVRLLRAEDSLARARTSEPLGFDDSLWSTLGRFGVPGMAIPTEFGGAGGSLLDVALIAEAAGRYLAPVPLVEGVTSARLLARHRSHFAAAVAEGSLLATIAVAPTCDGLARLVPAGAVADLVIGMVDDDLVVSGPSTPPVDAPGTLGSGPLADRDLRDGPLEMLASGVSAAQAHDVAVREWMTLMGASLVGAAFGALGLGLSYVKARKQFGVSIATFQAIAHRLADCATALDGARFLSLKAAWAADASARAWPNLAAMAYFFAGQTAQKVSAESLHFHGGYGFMLEYDIQLYFRRAKAWSLLLGDPNGLLDMVGDTVLAGAPG
jgi:alkylation response protein AidB-like acyl-CoA dehydrogenase